MSNFGRPQGPCQISAHDLTQYVKFRPPSGPLSNFASQFDTVKFRA